MRLIPFRWLPQTLAGRIFMLHAAILVIFVALGSGLFYRYQMAQTLEEARQAAAMLTTVTAQTLTESAVIGDYDTIQSTLQQMLVQSPFSSATFLAVGGATLQAIAPGGRPPASAPAWLKEWLAPDLRDVNQTITVGGHDYGILRLRFDVDELASGLWRSAQPAMILALAALVSALLLSWFPLKRWLGALDRSLRVQHSTAPEQSPEMQRLLRGLPQEFRPMVLALNQTASTLRHDLQARDKALIPLRKALSDSPDPSSDSTSGTAPNDLARLAAAAARLVSERETNRQALERALEAAKAADEAKAQFLASISHELRTPLHGMLGALEILRTPPLSAQQKPYLDAAYSSAHALQTLIDEVLNFSQLQAGKLQSNTVRFELRRTVEDIVASFGQRAQDRQLELACFIAPSIPDRLTGDPRYLQQILATLIGNALKFTERGEVVVCVTAEPSATARILLHFEVRDTGIGIPADKQALLFQPFVQADGSHSRRFGGTGLGLSIARQLAELMGGTIDLDSTAGVGSRFRLSLPFAVTQPAEPAIYDDLAGARLLVAGDNATSRIIAQRYLPTWSVQPDSVASGAAALSAAQNAATTGRPYQMVLLDCILPDMDGLTLAQRLRQAAAGMETRLLMFGPSSQKPADILVVGIDVWLDKPVRQAQLHDAIATLRHRLDSLAFR